MISRVANRLNIRVEALDEIVLSGLKGRLMSPEVYQEFLAAYIAERNTVLAPEGGQRVEIRGALAGILALSAPNNKTARVGPDGSVSVLCEQMKLVAGARFERAAFRL
jgi:hypothetical protein